MHEKIRGQNTDNRRTWCAVGGWAPCPRTTRKRLVDVAFRDNAAEGNRTPEPVRAGDSQSPARPRTCSLAASLRWTEAGASSVLEYRYVHRVERPHRLPVARRQARVRHGTGSRYLDNLYEGFAVCVELDGTAAHPADEQWCDKRRDTANAVRGILTLRFGSLDVGDRGCQTAIAVASVLRSRGWPGTAYPCSRPGCPVTP